MADQEQIEGEVERAAKLILEARYLIASTGAGISVESGIPPFRGPGGVWTRYGEPPMDGFQRFLADPKAHWERQLQERVGGAMSELRRGIQGAKPNPGHYALAELERLGVLKYTITQYVDGLHREAGSTRLVEIHGSRGMLRCIGCGLRMPRAEFQITDIPPHCPECDGLIKGDGVMFGEPIPGGWLKTCYEQIARADCMLLVGTSGVVYPAAAFPQEVKSKGGCLIEVNPYDTELSYQCDVFLRGPSGDRLPELVAKVKEKLGVH